jgi:hypothetical protein
MARDKTRTKGREFPFDDVEIGATHSASHDLQQKISRLQ